MTAAEATAALAAAGIESARLDAEVLLAHALGVSRTELLTRDHEPPPEYEALVRRRAAHEPVAYITGRRWFRDIELLVDPRVLIPRPETEHVVEAALDLPAGARVVDVGTGSGAIALALKHERPDLEVVGTDVSEDALAVARENGARLGLDVQWAQGDLLLAVEGRVDAVVSNPPYVADGDPLPADVAQHEPALALFAGPDGLGAYRRLAPQIAASGASSCALEVGAGQAGDVRRLLRGVGAAEVEIVPDLAGIERVVVARW